MAAEFRGSYTVAVTPFTEDGSAIDVPGLKKFLDWQIDVGVPGIIMLGTTGEFLTASDEERRLIVDTTVKHVRGRMKVLIGTMNMYTLRAVRYSREAEELGADGLMIAPPYYCTPTEDEIFNYYHAISEAVSIPIMLYNNPFTTHVDMPAKLVGRMTRAFENVRYIKEASMDVARVFDIVEETQGMMNVFAGERIYESCTGSAPSGLRPTRTATTFRWLRRASGTCSLRGAWMRPSAFRASSTRLTIPSRRGTRFTVISATPRRSPALWAIRLGMYGRH